MDVELEHCFHFTANFFQSACRYEYVGNLFGIVELRFIFSRNEHFFVSFLFCSFSISEVDVLHAIVHLLMLSPDDM